MSRENRDLIKHNVVCKRCEPKMVPLVVGQAFTGHSLQRHGRSPATLRKVVKCPECGWSRT